MRQVLRGRQIASISHSPRSAARVVITQDVDFLRLHAEGTPHAGIAFWRQQTRSIGEALRRLLLIHAAMSPDEMKNRVDYL